MTDSFGPFRVGHHTQRGPRETNQDTVLSIALPENRWLLAVADGMGGLEEGELASKTALGALYQTLCQGADLTQAVREANTAVYQEARGRVMGTTLVAAVVSGRQVEVVNVGDSRAYQSDLLGLIQVTRDHTLANEAERDGLVPSGEIEEDSNRWAGALARYLGEGPDVEVDRFGPLDLPEGGWLLLCSDGLHGVMSMDEMDEFLVGMTEAQKAAAGLVNEALERGTTDNVSVALLHWPEAEPSRASPPPIRGRGRRERGEKILIGSSKGRRPRKTLGLALKVFLIVIPLMIALVFLLDWLLS